MRLFVRPSAIDGVIAAPPSKSVMIRATAVALLSQEPRTTILNPSLCEDALSCLGAAKGLGANVSASPESVVIEGGIRYRKPEIDCGESGLCLRMFTAIAALLGEEVTLTGRAALRRRPLPSIEAPLSALGAACRTLDGLPPVTVRGPLRGGFAEVDGHLSSQFLTGLLVALPNIENDTVLHVRNLTSRPYVDLTIDLLARCGVTIERDDGLRYRVPGGQRPAMGEFRVEGDWSAAAALLVLGVVGGRVRVTGLDPESLQADRGVLAPLEDAGARIELHADGVEVAGNDLRAFEFDVTDAPDLLPPLAALACHCEGESVLRNVGRLAHKESSRAEVMARELSGLGVAVELENETLTIRGGTVGGGEARSHGDHRIAMALAAVAVRARAPVAIDGAEHVAKTYPSFFADLSAAGGNVDQIAGASRA